MKRLKKVVSGLVAAVMAVSSAVTSVGAEGDTTNAEVAFSLKYLDSLPKKEDANFDEFLKLPDTERLQEKRVSVVKHKNGTTEDVPINEKEVYGKIQQEVNRIEKDVKEKKFEKEILDENRRKEYESLPEKMKIAGAIYEWVANNIEYDFESYENVKKYYTDIMAYDESATKPQDAFFVYEKKMGMCAGKADLTALMMKIAEIPSAYVCSINGKDGMGHAYNAIYLEGNNGDRTGWTLLDPTWGASKSDRNLREVDENNINSLIKGTGYYYDWWIKYSFNRDDEYTRAIVKTINIDFTKGSIDESEIQDLNSRIKEKLKNLNSGVVDGFRFKKLEFSKCGNNNLKVDYETDLLYSDAAEINKAIMEREENEAKEAKEGFTEKKDSLFCDEKLEQLNDEFLNGIRHLANSDESRYNERCKIYSEEIGKIIYEKVLKEYKDKLNKLLLEKDEKGLQEIINQINEKIKPQLDEINEKFTDIRTLTEFSVYLDSQFLSSPYAWIAISAKAKISLDSEKIEEEFKKQQEDKQKYSRLSRPMTYFPAAYNIKLNFKSSNEEIIKHDVHTIKTIDCCSNENKAYGDYYKHEFKINGAKYELDGKEGSVCIKLSGKDGQPATDVKIPSDITKLGMIFNVGSGIESLNLQGDEILDLSGASMLKKINAEKSNKYINKYIAKAGILFDKNTNKVKSVFNQKGKTEEGIDYKVRRYNNGKIDYICFGCGDSGKKQYYNVIIPEYLAQLDGPVLLFGGIKSLILKGDEIVDLHYASELESINITDSTRYEEHDGKIFDKKLNKKLELPENSKIEIINNK